MHGGRMAHLDGKKNCN